MGGGGAMKGEIVMVTRRWDEIVCCVVFLFEFSFLKFWRVFIGVKGGLIWAL